MIQLQTVLIT